MRITLVGTDPESNPTNSPTVYRTDRGSWLVQGWTPDEGAVAQMRDLTGKPVPEGESVVEIPDRMLQFFVEDGS